MVLYIYILSLIRDGVQGGHGPPRSRFFFFFFFLKYILLHNLNLAKKKKIKKLTPATFQNFSPLPHINPNITN